MGVQFVTLGEARQLAANTPADILDGVLHSGTTILYGPSGIGKGRIIAEIVAAAVAGKPWAGRRWTRPVRKVAILATDIGADREYGAYLDRTGIGLEYDDAVRVYRVGIAPSSADWRELCGSVLGWGPGLVVLDNGTEMVRGSVNDNERVSDLFADLRPLHSGPDRVSLLVAHHTAKPDPQAGNRRSRTPLGSVAWENFSRSKVYVREAYGRDNADLTLEIRPRESAPWEAHLLEKDGRLVFDHAGNPGERQKRSRADTLARDGQIADWYAQNCQGVTNAEASRRLAVQFPELSPKAKNRPAAIEVMFAQKRGFAALIPEAEAA